MNLLFMSSRADRYRTKVRIAEAAYREAIRDNKEFSELKKIYRTLKAREKELQVLIDKGMLDYSQA